MIVLERDYTNKSVVCQGNKFHLWGRIIAVPEDTRYGKHYQKTIALRTLMLLDIHVTSYLYYFGKSKKA